MLRFVDHRLGPRPIFGEESLLSEPGDFHLKLIFIPDPALYDKLVLEAKKLSHGVQGEIESGQEEIFSEARHLAASLVNSKEELRVVEADLGASSQALTAALASGKGQDQAEARLGTLESRKLVLKRRIDTLTDMESKARVEADAKFEAHEKKLRQERAKSLRAVADKARAELAQEVEKLYWTVGVYDHAANILLGR